MTVFHGALSCANSLSGEDKDQFLDILKREENCNDAWFNHAEHQEHRCVLSAAPEYIKLHRMRLETTNEVGYLHGSVFTLTISDPVSETRGLSLSEMWKRKSSPDCEIDFGTNNDLQLITPPSE
jgi:hypothetical protein